MFSRVFSKLIRHFLDLIMFKISDKIGKFLLNYSYLFLFGGHIAVQQFPEVYFLALA